MTAAGVLALKDLLAVPGLAAFLPVVLLGGIVAGLVGYFVIRWFLTFLKTRNMLLFALYCALVAVAVLLVMGIR